MLVQVPGPKILSAACHEYSAHFDVTNFDPERTPRELGVTLPATLSRAVSARQAEFVAGRFAAFSALRAAGCEDPGNLETNPDRSPVWPAGFIGSITHTTGFVSAAVAPVAMLRALGRDTERILDQTTAREIQELALRPAELKRAPTSGFALEEYTGIVFSAKESLFKALAPLVQSYFDFQDAEVISISRESGLIRFRLESDLGTGFRSGFELDARFVVSEHIHTAVELPREKRR